MSQNSKIEWTDDTWNPVRGCTRVSEGCRNCYAEAAARRFSDRGSPFHGFAERGRSGSAWTGKVALIPSMLDMPMRWRRPRRVFVNSMSDLFHEDLPDEAIDQVFAVMALSPRHTFQVLTKRADRMHAYMTERWQPAQAQRLQFHDGETLDIPAEVGGETRRTQIERACEPLLERFGLADTTRDDLWTEDGSCKAMQWSWPLPNVWLGVSVENQDAADARIPALLRTPAARRFLSCEPLIGPVDLAGWGSASAPEPADTAPATWTEYQWPDWIPDIHRGWIKDFWREAYGRGPRAWMRDNHGQRMPATGARIGFVLDHRSWASVVPALSPEATGHGRYVHLWNNIGSIIRDDGKVIPSSASPGPLWLARWPRKGGISQPRIQCVILGGESGPKARPAHPEWFRSLRDQCAAAGVPFFFKQWGEWEPNRTGHAITGRTIPGSTTKHETATFPDGTMMNRVGKTRAGNTLDGRQHLEFPA